MLTPVKSVVAFELGRMTDALQEKTLAYLHSHNVLTLATSGPEGVWAAAVFYVNAGFNLFFLSAPTTRHCINIAADPRVSGAIHEDYREWPDIRGIQLEGEARRIEGEERLVAIARYGRKFPVVGNLEQAPVEIARAMGRIAWYRVTPDVLYFIDNSLGFGHREEVSLV